MTRMPNDMHGIDSEVFLVGDLRVEVGQQRVTRAGIEIALPFLSFELFMALVRVAPNFLSNDLLMARVWPGQIVTPETVTKRVNVLRVALGDSAKEPRYIAGVRGRGYRLVAAVSTAEHPAPLVEGPSSAPLVVAQPKELSTGHGSHRASNSHRQAAPDVVARVACPVGGHCRSRSGHANDR